MPCTLGSNGCAHPQNVGNGSNPYYSSADERAAQDANFAMSAYCISGTRAINRGQEGRWFLEHNVLGETAVFDILKDAESPQDALHRVLSPGLLAPAALPLLLPALLLLSWLCCCWSICPTRCPSFCFQRVSRCWNSCCMKFCRRGAKHRSNTRWLKACGLVALVVLFGCLLGITILSTWGFQMAKDGFNNVACTSSRLLRTSLFGQASPAFLGTLPALDVLWALDQVLSDNSTFATEVESILFRTASLDQAMTVASGTLYLLRNTMQDSANTRPHNQSGEDLLHTCQFCSDMRQQSDEALAALNGSVAAALGGTHAEVDSQLRPGKRADFQRSLREAANVVVEIKGSLRGLQSSIVETDLYKWVKDFSYVHYAVLVGSFLFFACSCSSWMLFACMGRDPAREARGANPYFRRVDRCACCSWCCGCWFACLFGLLGGVHLLVAQPSGSLCLALDGLNGQKLREIAPALGLDMAGDQGDAIMNVADQCISASSSAPSGTDMLGLLFTRVNGTKVTFRSSLFDDLQKHLNASFRLAAQRMSNKPLYLANASEVQRLRAILSNNPVDTMLIADGTAMRSILAYQDLVLDPRGVLDGIEVGFEASAACADHNVSAEMRPFSLQKILGIQTFVDRLAHFGMQVPGTGCTRQVSCNGSLTTNESRACTAGNNYVGLKKSLLEFGAFKCNLFEFPNGSTCDPLSMHRSGSSWHNDCLHPDGTMQVKVVPCHLADFVAYVQAFDSRIARTLDRLDSEVNEAQNEIGTQLSRLVQENILAPLDSIADKAYCDFLGQGYKEFVESFCAEGVAGLSMLGWSYIAFSGVASLLTVLLFAIWRLAIDNVEYWEDNNMSREVHEQHKLPPDRADGWDELDVEEEARPCDRILSYSPMNTQFKGHLTAVRLPN